jgi:serine/threonine-protein kinase
LENNEIRLDAPMGFALFVEVIKLGIPMSQPIDFGICGNGKKVYQLLSWIEGVDAEAALPLLSEAEQYMLGVKSGEILRKIHSVPAPVEDVTFLPYQKDWAERFNRKADRNIKMYNECEIKLKGGENYLSYIEQNRKLLENRPQCFHHGDYHVGNMIISGNTLSIIDFNRCDFGDPWEEFNRIVWSAMASPHFATGQLRGYFGGEPPIAFFKVLAFYVSCNMLASIPWAIPYGQSDIDTMVKQSHDVLNWFSDMTDPVPTWYLRGYEVWDVLDAEGNKTGRFHERGMPMNKGEHHLEVFVWVRNDNGEYLISQRSPNKTNPNMWECTGGNAVVGDDSLTTALKEVKEELGIILDPQNGQMIKHRLPCSVVGCRGLIDVWLFRQNIDISTVILAPEETCNAMWATADKIREMMAAGEFLSEQFYTYFDEMVKKHE